MDEERIEREARRAFSLLAHRKFEWNAEHAGRTLFTAAYEHFLHQVLEFAEIVTLRDLPKRNRGRCLLGLRFDVDGDPLTAIFTASIEHHLGVPSTYYFLPTADYYGTWREGRADRNPGIFVLMRYLQDCLGRAIGYHDDWVRLFVEFGLRPEDTIRTETEYWRSRGIRVDSICAHNSAYVYGIGGYEIWRNQSIGGRSCAQLSDGRKVSLGTMSLRDFGFAFDANFISSLSWRSGPIEAHGRWWQRAEEMSRDVDYQFFLGYDGLCTVHRGEKSEVIAEGVPFVEIPGMMRASESGSRWLFLGHPEYFAAIPSAHRVDDAYQKWVDRTAVGCAVPGAAQALLQTAIENWSVAFPVARKLLGMDVIGLPSIIRSRIRYYARRNAEGVYWENARDGVHFMAPYMERTFNFVMGTASTPAESSLLDLAGGCGNLGLSLCLNGFGHYFLNDIVEKRVRWARELFADYGIELNAKSEDLRTADFGRRFDYVTLLGWENFDVTYDDAIRTAARWQVPGGWLILTYQDHDEYQAGGWGDQYRAWHGREPEILDGLYTISRWRLLRTLSRYDYEIQGLSRAGHAENSYGYYPQYLLFALRK